MTSLLPTPEPILPPPSGEPVRCAPADVVEHVPQESAVNERLELLRGALPEMVASHYFASMLLCALLSVGAGAVAAAQREAVVCAAQVATTMASPVIRSRA